MVQLVGQLYRHLLRKRTGRVLILFFMMMIASLLEVIGIGLIPVFILSLSDPGSLLMNPRLGPLLESMNITTQHSLILLGAFLLMAIYLIKNIYLGFYYYIKKSLMTDLSLQLQSSLFSRYLYAPYTFFIESNSSELLRNIISEVHRVIDNVLLPLLELVLNCIMILLILLLLLFAEPFISILAIGMLAGVGLLFNAITRKKIAEYGKRDLAYRHEMNKSVIEGLGSFKDARVRGVEKSFLDHYHKNASASRLNNIYLYVVRQIPRPVTELLAVGTMLMITFILIWQERSFTEEILPILALYGASAVKMMPMVVMLISNLSMVRYNRSSVDTVVRDLTRLSEKSTSSTATAEEERVVELQKEIHLNEISYRYPGAVDEVVKKVTLTIPKGSVIAFAGESGSGKTTLADIILGLLPPHEGEVTVDGRSIQENLTAWQKRIGYVPQSIFLIDDTIRRNIAFGIPESEIDDERVKEVLELAKLTTFVEGLPEKEQTLTGERGIRLSGGQRQRIGIARALYHEPDVLILDEATSSLDSFTESAIIEAIDRLKGERTILMIAHRLSTVIRCDNIYLFSNGKIAEQGSYEELMRSNKEFRRLAMQQELTNQSSRTQSR